MMRDSGSVKLYWSLSRGPWGRWRVGTTTGVGPSLGFGLRARVLGVGRQSARLHSVPGPGLLRRLSPGPSWPAAWQRRFHGDDQPSGISVCSACSVEGEQLVDLRAQLAVELEQTFVTDRTALGGMGMDFVVQADVAKVNTPISWAYKRMCTKRIFSSCQKGFAEVGNGVMIRMNRRKEVERHERQSYPFNLAGTEGACGVAINNRPRKFPVRWPRHRVDYSGRRAH